MKIQYNSTLLKSYKERNKTVFGRIKRRYDRPMQQIGLFEAMVMFK